MQAVAHLMTVTAETDVAQRAALECRAPGVVELLRHRITAP